MENPPVVVLDKIRKADGRTVLYRINERFYLKNELSGLILRAVDAYPPELKERLLNNRRRPRAKGKPVVYLKDSDKKAGA